MKTVKLDIPVGRIESLEDVLAFMLRLEAWDARQPEQTYAISRRRTDVRVEEKHKTEQRSGRDGLL